MLIWVKSAKMHKKSHYAQKRSLEMHKKSHYAQKKSSKSIGTFGSCKKWEKITTFALVGKYIKYDYKYIKYDYKICLL